MAQHPYPNQPGSFTPPPDSIQAHYGARFKSRIKTPALCLIICTILSLVMMVGAIGASVIRITTGIEPVPPPPSSFRHLSAQDPDYVRMKGVINLVSCTVIFSLQCLVLFGAIQMYRLKSYGFAMTANILCLIPCISPCCIIGIPFGIWGLTALSSQNAKSFFR